MFATEKRVDAIGRGKFPIRIMLGIGSSAIIKEICAFFVVCGFRQIELFFLKKRAIVLDSPGVWVRAAHVTLVYAFDNCGERASTMNP